MLDISLRKECWKMYLGANDGARNPSDTTTYNKCQR